jgi:hypothetical protein
LEVVDVDAARLGVAADQVQEQWGGVQPVTLRSTAPMAASR